MAKRNEVLNVLDLLTEQHADVDALIGVLENGKGDRVAAFAELADSLAAHAEVEEKIFYPRVMSAQTSELLHESVQEHLAMKRGLADLLAAKLDDDDFDAKLSVLKETVSHHAEEEAHKLVPILRKLLTEDDLAALGNEVLALFETLMKSSPRNQVPRQTREAARLPSA